MLLHHQYQLYTFDNDNQNSHNNNNNNNDDDNKTTTATTKRFMGKSCLSLFLKFVKFIKGLALVIMTLCPLDQPELSFPSWKVASKSTTFSSS